MAQDTVYPPITVLSLLGLLFCFRRASTLMPRNLSIQLENMFSGQDGGVRARRGPIALSDEDLAGAQGLDWDELEDHSLDRTVIALDSDEEENEQDEGQELQEGTRAFARYTEDDDEDAQEEEEGAYNVSVNVPERQEDSQFQLDDEDDDDAALLLPNSSRAT
ncbi:hypothetical protein BGZ74_006168 [Mortierella antarctica]|nr:hypothetical protein BGZ74_006168 [Mortierella antarctica]